MYSTSIITINLEETKHSRLIQKMIATQQKNKNKIKRSMTETEAVPMT